MPAGRGISGSLIPASGTAYAAFKSSLNSQPFTGIMSATTAFLFHHAAGTSAQGYGGFGLFAASSTTSYKAIDLEGFSGNATIDQTTINASGAIVYIQAGKNNAGARGGLAANDNLFILSEWGAGAQIIVKGDGRLYVNTTAAGAGFYVGLFDDEQDAVACRDLPYVIASKGKQALKYDAERFKQLGILDNGFLCMQNASMLTLGAIGELYHIVDIICKKMGLTYEELRQSVRGPATR
jgi:hypothetical protein